MARPFRLCSLPGARHFRISLPTSRTLCNPSIAANGDRFAAIVRTVNFTPDTYWEARNAGALNTLNWLVELDSGLNILRAQEIDDREFREADERCGAGFEDARLFFWRGSWWYTASAQTKRHPPFRSTMSLNRLDGARVAASELIDSPAGEIIEKNWMPSLLGGGLQLIYRPSPMQVLFREGKDFILRGFDADQRFVGWSGSSQLVPYGGKEFCVVHRYFEQDGRRIYEHAFLELEDFRIVRASAPWYFDQPGVEFCGGLALTRTHAILSYGFLDSEARLLKIPLKFVEMMLREDFISRGIVQALYAAGRLKERLGLFSPIENLAAPR